MMIALLPAGGCPSGGGIRVEPRVAPRRVGVRGRM